LREMTGKGKTRRGFQERVRDRGDKRGKRRGGSRGKEGKTSSERNEGSKGGHIEREEKEKKRSQSKTSGGGKEGEYMILTRGRAPWTSLRCGKRGAMLVQEGGEMKGDVRPTWDENGKERKGALERRNTSIGGLFPL